MKKLFIILLGLIALSPSMKLLAQEIQAQVTINMDYVDPENRVYVSTMQRDVENYLNNNKFTKLEWEGPKIPVDVSIFLTGGNKGVYAGKLFIAAKRYVEGQEGGATVTLRAVDEKWAFPYSQGASLSFNIMRFDEFTSLLDFYILTIIGYDADTYGELEGSHIYDQAKQIIQMGAARGVDGYSTMITPGEYTKFSIINELTDIRYEDFRKLIYSFYVDGLDEMAKNKEKGLDNLAKVVADMAEFKEKKLSVPSALLQLFFDTKGRDLAGIFEGYKKDMNVFKNLIYLDPSNTRFYEESKNK